MSTIIHIPAPCGRVDFKTVNKIVLTLDAESHLVSTAYLHTYDEADLVQTMAETQAALGHRVVVFALA